MSDDVIEGDEGDSPVISERVQVINALLYMPCDIIAVYTYVLCVYL